VGSFPETYVVECEPLFHFRDRGPVVRRPISDWFCICCLVQTSFRPVHVQCSVFENVVPL